MNMLMPVDMLSDPIAAHARDLIAHLGEDPRRAGLADTPERYAQAMRYLDVRTLSAYQCEFSTRDQAEDFFNKIDNHLPARCFGPNLDEDDETSTMVFFESEVLDPLRFPVDFGVENCLYFPAETRRVSIRNASNRVNS